MPTAEWKRLGEQLVRRRIELDPRYSNRKLFVAERGLNYRTVTDIEHGRRDNYEPATIAAAEVAYAVSAGSIGHALAGGSLQPDQAASLAPAAVTGSAGTYPGPPRMPSLKAQEEYPADPPKQWIYDIPGLSEKERQVLLDTMDSLRVKPAAPGNSGNRESA